MIPVTQINYLLQQMGTGNNSWGVGGRGRKREREKQIITEKERERDGRRECEMAWVAK
jgi:hypothetical protein